MTALQRICFRLIALLGAALLACPQPVLAATNVATGGMGGLDNGTFLGGDGTGRAQFSLNTVDLALVKQALDLAGNPLPEDADVDAGQDIYFVLFVDNPTPAPVTDVRFTDPLNEAHFTYIPNSLESVVLPAGSSDSEAWSAAWSALTDSTGSPDDFGSVRDTGGSSDPDIIIIGAGGVEPNRVVGIPEHSRLAVRFKVRVN